MKTNPRKTLMKLNRRKPMKIENHRNIDSRLKQKRKLNMKKNKNFISKINSKNLSFFLILFIAVAGLVLSSSEVLAVKDAADAGLSVGVTNLMGILNNKLTPVVLVAGCLASLAYSLAIAQPKPFIMGLVTLCGFGFAKAWIAGTYALVG